MVGRGSWGIGLLGALALTACSLTAPLPGRVAPIAPLPPVPPSLTKPPLTPPAGSSAESERVRTHFSKIEADLLSRGLLRSDGGGQDTPVGDHSLLENFVRIALYDEYSTENGRLVARETPSHLRRWQAPIRIGLRFGDSVPDSQRQSDRRDIEALVSRLGAVTGHPIRLSEQNPNYWVYIVSESERPALPPVWASHFPGMTAGDLMTASQMDLNTFCMVLAISDGDSPLYTGALAVIRSELPDTLRRSCLHEEIAQGLGLANDFAMARPSIFNDDEEFATLTPMDETLLRLLYHPQLAPGMTEAEARPILAKLIPTLRAGDS